MLDHVGFSVADFERSKDFYRRALAPLGLQLLMEVTEAQTGAGAHAGFGAADKPFFWIGTGERPKGGVHVAFTAATRDVVDAFHREALAAGGVDNGGPGLRPHYHANYSGAFALDPDGNNLEAVCHAPAD